MFRKILVPTDGSALSQRAVAAVIEFARATGAQLIGLSVAEQVTYPILPEAGTAEFIVSLEESTRAYGQRQVEQIAQAAAAAGVVCETMVVQGITAHEEILNAARDRGCDLIWMASHGRRGLDRLLLGSQTQKVLSYSGIPVLVYRDKVRDE